MSKQLFEKVLKDIQSQLNVNVELLAQEQNISSVVKESIRKCFQKKYFQEKEKSFQEEERSFQEKEKSFQEKSSQKERSIEKYPQAESFCVKTKERVYNEFIHYGPLQPLLNLKGVNEILINGPESIWYEVNGKVHLWEDIFYSQISFDNCIHRICHESSIKVDLAQPSQDAHWKQFRLHIVRPPISQKVCLSLRAHASNPWSWDHLQQSCWANPKGIQLMKKLVHSHS